MSACICGAPDAGVCTCPKPPAAPELPEGWSLSPYNDLWHLGCCIDLNELRALLATQGLSIVDAKDRAVLEAMSQVPDEMLHNSIEYKYAHEASKPVAQAEIARREKP